MPFREKTAWAMMMVLIVGGLYYFNLVVSASRVLGSTSPPVIGFVIAYVVLIVVASVVLMVALAVSSPNDADAPADERERLIEDKAGHIAGSILGIGVFAAMLHYAWRADGNLMFHIALGSLMVSQIAEYALQIWFYRRGA